MVLFVLYMTVLIVLCLFFIYYVHFISKTARRMKIAVLLSSLFLVIVLGF